MPFNTLCLSNNYEGLFPPGLGTKAYVEASIALLEVLQHLLMPHEQEIQAIILAVGNSSQNGYDLLWHVIELYVPGFDPTLPIAQPLWDRDSTILEFSKCHLLYFCLMAKKNMFFSA